MLSRLILSAIYCAAIICCVAGFALAASDGYWFSATVCLCAGVVLVLWPWTTN